MRFQLPGERDAPLIDVETGVCLRQAVEQQPLLQRCGKVQVLHVPQLELHALQFGLGEPRQRKIGSSGAALAAQAVVDQRAQLAFERLQQTCDAGVGEQIGAVAKTEREASALDQSVQIEQVRQLAARRYVVPGWL